MGVVKKKILFYLIACNVLPTIPYVDVNKTKGNAFLPGTVLHFKCSANTMPDIDNVTVTTECMRNNTWVIHGAHHCQPGKNLNNTGQLKFFTCRNNFHDS